MFIISSFAYSQDLASGKKLYKKCMSCHGADGYGKKSQKAPMIAGQYEWYLKAQITNIRDQKRVSGNSKKMYAMVKGLKDEHVADLAAYIATLPLRR